MPAVSAPGWWPPADGDPIGDERARELVTWLKTVAPAAVEQAREYLATHYPGRPQSLYAVKASQLATLAFSEGMRGLCIGSVSARAVQGPHGTVGIALTREGRMAITVREPGEAVQRWEPV